MGGKFILVKSTTPESVSIDLSNIHSFPCLFLKGLFNACICSVRCINVTMELLSLEKTTLILLIKIAIKVLIIIKILLYSLKGLSVQDLHLLPFIRVYTVCHFISHFIVQISAL